MSDKTNAVLASLLTLPADERAEIAKALLASLDDLPEPTPEEQAEIDASWEVEIERRVQECREGKAELLSGDEVMKSLRAKYQK